MAKVTVSWRNNAPVNSDASPGSIQVGITGGTLPAALTTVVPLNATTATIDDVPAEAETDPDYVAGVQLLDTAGALIGVMAVSDPFSVLEPPSLVMTPGSVTVVVGEGPPPTISAGPPQVAQPR